MCSGGGRADELRGVHVRAGDGRDAAGRAVGRVLGRVRRRLPARAAQRVRATRLRALAARRHAHRVLRAARLGGHQRARARRQVPRAACATCRPPAPPTPSPPPLVLNAPIIFCVCCVRTRLLMIASDSLSYHIVPVLLAQFRWLRFARVVATWCQQHPHMLAASCCPTRFSSHYLLVENEEENEKERRTCVPITPSPPPPQPQPLRLQCDA